MIITTELVWRHWMFYFVLLLSYLTSEDWPTICSPRSSQVWAKQCIKIFNLAFRAIYSRLLMHCVYTGGLKQVSTFLWVMRDGCHWPPSLPEAAETIQSLETATVKGSSLGSKSAGKLARNSAMESHLSMWTRGTIWRLGAALVASWLEVEFAPRKIRRRALGILIKHFP